MTPEPGRSSSNSSGIDSQRDFKQGCVNCFFLDSGAFSLYTGTHKVTPGGAEFWERVDSYAEFVTRYQSGMDYYANLDAIGNPELTWEVQKYLEGEYGLSPVPVVHCGTHLKWLDRYLDSGYEFIGIGGLASKKAKSIKRDWLDRVFNVVCSTPGRLPRVRTHGFAVTSYGIMIRYPWWSVDSTTWRAAAGYGEVIVPHKRRGEFVFDVSPYRVGVSMDYPRRGQDKDIRNWSRDAKAIVMEWLEKIQIPFEVVAGTDDVAINAGFVSAREARCVAIAKFFEVMGDQISPYPWPFKTRVKQGFFS